MCVISACMAQKDVLAIETCQDKFAWLSVHSASWSDFSKSLHSAHRTLQTVLSEASHPALLVDRTQRSQVAYRTKARGHNGCR